MQPVLVIISISINNANLSLRGIILGNDLESESRCALSASRANARGWERFVRAERRLHRASRSLDRSTIDRSRTADRSTAKAESVLGDSYRARSYSSKVCRNFLLFFFSVRQPCSILVLLIYYRAYMEKYTLHMQVNVACFKYFIGLYIRKFLS